jgi:hypothetical protein
MIYMSLFEQSLINHFVFSENQIVGGAPITELINTPPRMGEILGGQGTKNPLTNKKHLSVPVGLVMMSHTEYVYPSNTSYRNTIVQPPLHEQLIELVTQDEPAHNKSLKHRKNAVKKHTKKQGPTKEI